MARFMLNVSCNEIRRHWAPPQRARARPPFITSPSVGLRSALLSVAFTFVLRSHKRARGTAKVAVRYQGGTLLSADGRLADESRQRMCEFEESASRE